MSDWLSLGGVRTLDAANSIIGPNLVYVEGKTRPQATVRLTGVEVNVELFYENSYVHSVKKPDGSDWEYSVCYVRVKATLPRQFDTVPSTAYALPQRAGQRFQSNKRTRLHHGIRFSFATSLESAFGFPDPLTFVTNIAVVVVYFTVCKTLIMFVAIYLLGNTSRNYIRAQRESVDVYVVEINMLSSRARERKSGTTLPDDLVVEGEGCNIIRPRLTDEIYPEFSVLRAMAQLVAPSLQLAVRQLILQSRWHARNIKTCGLLGVGSSG